MVVEEAKSNGGGTYSSQAAHCAKNEALTNGFVFGFTNICANPSSGERKDLRTYRRRRQGMANSESKLVEYGRVSRGAASHLGGQESDACDLGKQRCHSEERQLHHGNQLADKLHEGVSTNGPPKEAKRDAATTMCQRVFSSILTSEEFASLNELLSENFQGFRAENLFSMGLIDSRMKEGVYENSPALFSTDIQEVWKKFQLIGNEIISLAKSLSDLSRTYCSEQSHAKPPAAESVYGICTCNQCGEKANGRDCLVCDHCEDMYHVSCIQPAFKEIPKKSWYCLNCTSEGIGPPHENCVVCERLNVTRTPMNNARIEIITACEQNLNDVKESSSCNMDGGLHHSEGQKDSEMCRVCGDQVENGGRFITCDHHFCPHKYYHVRCLTMKQLKVYGPRWYCPSCLCRDCLMDKDDDKIVLCDGCDNAYHIYCTKPPLTSIPEGKWFCIKCEVAIQRIRRAKRAYENTSNLRNHTGGDGEKTLGKFEDKPSEKGVEETNKGSGGMDMLLNAANTLSHQENMAAHQMKD